MSKREEIQQEALKIAIGHKRCGLGISMGLFVKTKEKLYICSINM